MIDGTGMCGGCRGMIGDIMTGSATVILAMGAGRRAAKSIHEYLTTGEWSDLGWRSAFGQHHAFEAVAPAKSWSFFAVFTRR
jgi:hypothetical protein